jgi:predicted regulator of Ras-like GTPase activity (Roadblock/LC7/MglB family)
MPSEYREERLVRVLQEEIYDNIEAVQEAVIVTNDGLVVAAYPGLTDLQDAQSEDEGSHAIAALAAEIIAQSRRAFGRLDQGPVRRILVDGESSSMVVMLASNQTALAVMLDNNTKLGIAMFQIAHAAEQLSQLLD